MMQARDTQPVLEFERRKTRVTVLRLLNPSVETLARELDRRVQEAPARFRYLPVVLDVGAIAASDLYLDLPGFAALLRTRDLVPIAVCGGDARWADAAEAAGLRAHELNRDSPPRPQAATAANVSTATTPAERVAEAPLPSGRLVVTEPVRSGQQHYARGGDLVILAPVSFGAEVSADGHVHVYSTLQGRALAGVRGDKTARIFCRAFRADFVSIAGIYAVSEQFDDGLRGEPVQAFLQDDTLRVERL
ncbi:MAG TPA: septum site-determining protein MinC [Gammaproteobacteria bacterium]|nr:septum site-determining protein MinC [Gammaproteobacteria bacterium]